MGRLKSGLAGFGLLSPMTMHHCRPRVSACFSLSSVSLSVLNLSKNRINTDQKHLILGLIKACKSQKQPKCSLQFFER